MLWEKMKKWDREFWSEGGGSKKVTSDQSHEETKEEPQRYPGREQSRQMS